MKEYAHTLFPFENAYKKCVAVFISTFIEKEYSNAPKSDKPEEIFSTLKAICQKAQEIVTHVFRSPQSVMVTFVQEIVASPNKEQPPVFTGNLLKNHVVKWLEKVKTKARGDEFLEALKKAHKATKSMLAELCSEFSLADPGGQFEDKMLNSVFEDFTSDYIELEEQYLMATYLSILAEVEETFAPPIELESATRSPRRPKKGKKKGLPEPPTAPAVPQNIEDIGVEQTRISFDVASSMIHESQRALARCDELAPPSQVASNSQRIFKKLIDNLGNNHLLSALERADISHQLLKPTQQPPVGDEHQIFFFVVRDANNIVYLLQKHFWNHVLPAVRPSSDVHRRCVTQKNEVWQRMESLLAKGLDNALDIIIERCKLILATYQNNTDFRPADDGTAFMMETSSKACSVCVRYLRTQANDIMVCLNGQNLEHVLQELAARFHTALLRHFQPLTANELGGMLLSRDLHEYEKCVNGFENKFADELFAKFREASAVLLVPPENVKSLCSEGRLGEVDNEILHTFAQMRGDYKTANLAQYFVAPPAQ